MKDSVKINKDFFNYYDSKINKMFRVVDKKKKQLLSKLVGSGKVVLDFGSGAGQVTAGLTKNNTVYALDHDEKLLAQAKLNGLIPVTTDFSGIPFEENFFDTIISIDSIEHVDDRNKTFAEFKRVLKPGGQLIIFTPAYDNPLWPAIEKFINTVTGKGSGHLSPFTRESMAYFTNKYFGNGIIKKINLRLGLFVVAKK